MKTKKVKRKRLNIARLLVFILFIYLVVNLGIYIYKEPVHHYEISGTNFIKDIDVLEYSNLDEYPSFISINKKKLEKELKSNDYILNAKVKYGWNFTLKILIEENKPVFYSKMDNKLCLSDGSLVEYSKPIIGLPTLLNTTPVETRTTLANNLSKVDEGVLYIISEIEYKPSYNTSNQVIDSNRFLLAMNDKNMVFITAKKAGLLNKYLDVIATNQITSAGTLFLDGNEDNYTFKISNNKEFVNSEDEENEE